MRCCMKKNNLLSSSQRWQEVQYLTVTSSQLPDGKGKRKTKDIYEVIYYHNSDVAYKMLVFFLLFMFLLGIHKRSQLAPSVHIHINKGDFMRYLLTCTWLMTDLTEGEAEWTEKAFLFQFSVLVGAQCIRVPWSSWFPWWQSQTPGSCCSPLSWREVCRCTALHTGAGKTPAENTCRSYSRSSILYI